jgi:hypothetical protein
MESDLCRLWKNRGISRLHFKKVTHNSRDTGLRRKVTCQYEIIVDNHIIDIVSSHLKACNLNSAPVQILVMVLHDLPQSLQADSRIV